MWLTCQEYFDVKLKLVFIGSPSMALSALLYLSEIRNPKDHPASEINRQATVSRKYLEMQNVVILGHGKEEISAWRASWWRNHEG